MKKFFPFPILNVTGDLIERWNCFYSNPIISSRNNRIEEGLWRRTQREENKDVSGWRNDNDSRRRMVHYQYEYDLIEKGEGGFVLAITEFYLWWHVCMPCCEVSVYADQIYSSLQFGGWRRVYGLGQEQIFCCGDLYMRIIKYSPKENIYDKRSFRNFPDDYLSLEVTVFSAGNFKSEEFFEKPWKILDTGMRTKDKRGFPKINKWKSLQNFFPAQIELGCGPSIEAGIPPLHFLHSVYSITDKRTGAFILDPYHDSLIRSIISHPQESLNLFAGLYKACFIAQPTRFYHTLKELHDRGYVVGPIITNNFDGLANRVGLQELFVRRYEDTQITPSISFHPKAKSLIVVGSHADRRRIQHAARKTGIHVVYIDPEGYFENEEFFEYPLESPQDEDFLFRVTAGEFDKRIRSLLL